jgi:hypothetical protein
MRWLRHKSHSIWRQAPLVGPRLEAIPVGIARPAQARRLGKFQALEFDSVGADLGQIVMSLLRKPSSGAAAEYLRQAHGHFREIPRFSFTNSDNVVRVTPSAAAAWVMVSPKGSMHWRSTKPPGCGGFFIGMTDSS